MNDADTNLLISVLPYTLPFVIGALTLWFNRGVSQRSDTNARLTSQREDFAAIIGPIREELATYRDLHDALKSQVDTLEARLDREQRDKYLLITDVSKLKNHVNEMTPDDPVSLHPRVEKLVSDADRGVDSADH